MKRKLVGLGVALMAILSLLVIMYPNTASTKRGNTAGSAEQKKQHQTKKVAHESKPNALAPNSKRPIDSATKEQLLRAMRETRQWLLQKGYSRSKDMSLYEQYDFSVLEAMVRNDDEKAMWLVADRYLQMRRYDEAYDLYWKLAARGSLPSLEQLGSLALLRDIPGASLRDKQIESGAWYRLAERQGIDYVRRFQSLKVTTADYISPNLKNEQGEAEIEKRMLEILAKLPKEFDNSGESGVSETVESAWRQLEEIDKNYYDPSIPKDDRRRLSEIYAREI